MNTDKLTEEAVILINDFIESNSPFKENEDGENLVNEFAYDVAWHCLTNPDILKQLSLPKETDAVEWIRVEDGLPEEGQYVLISYKTIDGKRYIYTGFYFLGIWHFAEQGEEIGFQRKVTHWMPLPAPPKP